MYLYLLQNIASDELFHKRIINQRYAEIAMKTLRYKRQIWQIMDPFGHLCQTDPASNFTMQKDWKSNCKFYTKLMATQEEVDTIDPFHALEFVKHDLKNGKQFKLYDLDEDNETL